MLLDDVSRAVSRRYVEGSLAANYLCQVDGVRLPMFQPWKLYNEPLVRRCVGTRVLPILFIAFFKHAQDTYTVYIYICVHNVYTPSNNHEIAQSPFSAFQRQITVCRGFPLPSMTSWILFLTGKIPLCEILSHPKVENTHQRSLGRSLHIYPWLGIPPS